MSELVKYIAVIGDLVGSRHLQERDSVQKQLQQSLEEINRIFSSHISSGFVITIGDEFQGLLQRNFPLRQFLDYYEMKFGSKYHTRFGLGLGSLATTLTPYAVGMDGPCFHKAREALTHAREKGCSLQCSGFEMNEALCALFKMVENISSNWKQRQRKVIALYRESGDQASVARQLAITRQSVSGILKAARWELYQAGWTGIQQLFSFTMDH